MFHYSPSWLKMPKLQQLEGGNLFVLFQPYCFVRPSGERIIVPPSGLGTEQEIYQSPVWNTDLGSIPMLFQNIVQKAGPNTPAYVVHDWLYCSEMFDRETCDTILHEACVEQNDIIYDAVRLGGGEVWEHHNPTNVTLMKAYYQTFLSELSQRWPELIK